MEAMRLSILPKTRHQLAYTTITNDWPCFGIPEMIVCDRGADFVSKDLETAAFQLGIVLDFNPPRTPNLKGCVESFFGGLNDQLLSTLPGRTFRSWEARADYNADDGPMIPFDTLLEIIHVHLIDVYSRSKHPTLPQTRIEVWQASAAENPPLLPSSLEDLTVLLSRRAERTLSKRGIELNGMFYMSDELMALRADLAVNGLDHSRMTVRYNPWDLGAVQILNPLNGVYIRADAVDATLIGMTEYQWKVLRRAVRERFDSPDHQMSLATGRNKIRDLVDATMKKPSRRRRTKAARFQNESTSASVIDELTEELTEQAEPVPESAATEEAATSTIAGPIDCEDEELDLDEWEIDTTT